MSRPEVPPSSESEASPSVSPAPARSVDARQLRRNLLGRMLAMGGNMLVGLWLPPFLVRHLSLAVYGLIPLVNQVNAYATVFNTSVSTSTARFLTIDISRQDYESATRTLSTAVFGGMLFVLVGMGPLVGLLLWATPRFMRVPPGQEVPMYWLQVGALTALILGFLNNFSVVSFARNRLDIASAIEILQVLTRVGIVVALFYLWQPQVWQVGLGMAGGALMSLGCHIVAWRRLAPQVRLQWGATDWQRLRGLMSTGGWITINMMGILLYSQIDLVLVNRLVGPESGGAYGAILQWSVLLRMASTVVAGVLDPIMYARFGQDDEEGMLRLARRATKFLGLILGLPVGLMCGLSRPLLHTWMGASVARYWKLLWLLTFHRSVNQCTRPLMSINIARNQMRWPAVATLAIGLFNLGLAIMLGRRWGMYGVATAGMIAMTLRNAVFQTLYVSWTVQRSPRYFVAPLAATTLATLGLALGLHMLSSALNLEGWSRLAGIGLGSSLLYIFVMGGLFLDAEERALLGQTALPFLRRARGEAAAPSSEE